MKTIVIKKIFFTIILVISTCLYGKPIDAPTKEKAFQSKWIVIAISSIPRSLTGFEDE